MKDMSRDWWYLNVLISACALSTMMDEGGQDALFFKTLL